MIEDIMEHYDFNRVQKTMKLLDWTWMNASEPPSLDELRVKAHGLLDEAYKLSTKYKDGSYSECGGFRATADFSYNTLEVCSLDLLFSVTGWDVSVSELERFDADDDNSSEDQDM